jgi:predicted transcriptional regulator
MKRTTVFLEAALESDLKALARRQGQPMAAVVREALEAYVAVRKRRTGARLRFVAFGRSGFHDSAERHEELLFARLDPHGESAPAGGRGRRRVPVDRGVARRARSRRPRG